MGRWLPDDNIEFLGREDFQVKIQGYRVELGEIELTLGQHPKVKLAIAVAVGERRGNKHLAAYVLFEEEKVPGEELGEFLRSRLPAYMVPSSFIALDVLPLTANGKVDRAALPLVEQQKSARAHEWIEPRDQVERDICRIWEEVLNVSPVGLGANFFELGGHSLLAVRLMNQLNRCFGANIPMSALFRQPTVEQIASLVRKEVNIDSEECLVPIQPSGSLPRFFWVHPMGGNVFCYAPLARVLGKEQPFFAFQSRSCHDQHAIAGGLEKMAADYCAELQRIQPNGPYFLGGWSMGGVVAFEMARQLSLAGHKVRHLAIVDAWAPIAGQIAMESDEASALIGFAGDLGIPLDRMSLGQLMSLENESRLNWIFEQAKAERILLPDDDLSRVRSLFDIFEHNRQVLATYVGKQYPGRITLFRASENLDMPASDPFLGWGVLAEGGVELHEAEGNHFTMLSALHISKLARTLIESVNAGSSGKPDAARAVGTSAHPPMEEW
jgi:thioesterase domain-containing protein/acyl carrier protein